MNSLRFRVGAVWLWIMTVGLVCALAPLIYYLHRGAQVGVWFVGLFLLYAGAFLFNYGMRPYISIREGWIVWILPPLFLSRRMELGTVSEFLGAGGPNLLLITRDGREAKIPLGFVPKGRREDLIEAIRAAIPDDAQGKNPPEKSPKD